MATITGSGKYVQISNGTLKIGNGSTLFANIYADSVTYNNAVYKGMSVASLTYLNLTGLNSLTIGDAQGYTGVIPMCTAFSDPYSVLIWDEEDYDISRITRTFKNYRFVNGVMVGEA